MEAVIEAAYMGNRPESFKTSADVILKLDTGETLPAHSAFLSFHSDDLFDMLSLKKSEDSRPQVLPFPDCTLGAAKSLLQCIYARPGETNISLQIAESLTVLANKFSMDNILRDVDNFLASEGTSDGSSNLWVRKQFPARMLRFTTRKFRRFSACSVLVQLAQVLEQNSAQLSSRLHAGFRC